jgi:betaine reductase
VCSMPPVALMFGSNRIVPSYGIVQPVGNADLEPREEKRLRRGILERALEALKTDLTGQKVFPRPG